MTSKCSVVVENTISSENITRLASKISSNVTSAGSGMFQGGSPPAELSQLSSQIDGTGLIEKLVSLVLKLIGYMIQAVSTILGWLGINFTATHQAILTTILALFMVVLLMDHFTHLFGKWIYNSIAGVIALFILHYLLGISIPISLFTLLVVASFGVPGLLAIIVLNIGGVI